MRAYAAIARPETRGLILVRLEQLRMHLIGGSEIASRVVDQSAIAWMVDRLHRHYEFHQLGIVVVDMFHQFRLCVRRPGNENRTRVGYRLGNAVEKILILCGVSAADGIRLVMDMASRVIGTQYQSVGFQTPDMKHAGLMVIDPDDGMIIMAHVLLLDVADLWCSGAFCSVNSCHIELAVFHQPDRVASYVAVHRDIGLHSLDAMAIASKSVIETYRTSCPNRAQLSLDRTQRS
jgi:hypothetical protein